MKYANFVIIAMLALLVIGCSASAEKTLTTQGTGSVTTDPDEATVFVTIQTEGKSADEVGTANAAKVEKVRAALLEMVDEKDIETNYFNINEQYDWTESGRQSRGYVAVHSLKVSTTDMDEIGAIIDAATQNGATSIDYVQFALSEEKRSEIKQQVLAQAGMDAREKADALAEGLGVKIVSIKSVQDSEYGVMPYQLAASEMAARDGDVSSKIEPRSVDVTAHVQVTYLIR